MGVTVVAVAMPDTPAPPAPTYPASVAPVAPTSPANAWATFVSYVKHAWQHYGVIFVGAILVEEATAYLHGQLATVGNVETVGLTAVAGVILATFQKPLATLAQ